MKFSQWKAAPLENIKVLLNSLFENPAVIDSLSVNPKTNNYRWLSVSQEKLKEQANECFNTTFYSEQIAQSVITQALRARIDLIANWMKNENKTFSFEYLFSSPIGFQINPETLERKEISSVYITLIADDAGNTEYGLSLLALATEEEPGDIVGGDIEDPACLLACQQARI